MAIIACILVGLSLGAFASKLMPNPERGAVKDAAMGTVGAMIAGVVFGVVSGQGFATITVPGLFASALGALALLGAHRLTTMRRLALEASEQTRI